MKKTKKKKILPYLEIARKGTSRYCVVFVHGIFSDPTTFEFFRERMVEDKGFCDWEFVNYHYNYNHSIRSNSDALAQLLTAQYGSEKDREVSLVCHSMGGLVGRYAALSKEMPFLKRLFLIGTPNFGAIRSYQVNSLALMTIASTRKLFAVFPRLSGILELTNPEELFKQLRIDNPGCFEYADEIEYVTIAGTYYNASRKLGAELSRPISIVTLSLALASILSPFKIELAIPNDGIVERDMNRMCPPDAGRLSEKKKAMLYPNRTPAGGYMHVFHEDCDDLLHTEIHGNESVIRLVCSILKSKSLGSWWEDLSTTDEDLLIIEPRDQYTR